MEILFGVLVLVMVYGLVMSATQAEPLAAPSLEDVLKTLPAQQNQSRPGFRRPVSGLSAQRARRTEVIHTVSQDPDAAASAVKQWLRE